MSLPAIINVNTIPPSPESISTINAYPLGTVRRDLGIQGYINYKNDWEFFNTVWSYNYTISTLNGLSVEFFGKYQFSPWQFANYADIASYSNGQMAHFAFYSNAPTNQFNNF
jgi:hypothetical protein